MNRLGLYGTLALVGTLWAAAPALALDYRVRAGDTLGEIAARFGVTVSDIRRANGIRGDLIRVDQVLTIPGQAPAAAPPAAAPPAAAAPTTTYTVRSGDTLGAIATRHRTTVAALKSANGLPPGAAGDLIRVGQQLRIPGGATTTAASAPRAGAPASSALVQRHPAMQASAAQLEVLARIVKGETPETVSLEGQVAVAAVVLNRVRSSGFPNSIAGVAHQPMQFSCYNANYRQRLYYGPIPAYAWEAARIALSGADPTQGSTHYFNPYLVQPPWARRLEFVRRIGSTRTTTHDFYRPNGTRTPTYAGATRSETTGAAGRLGGALGQ